MVAAGDRIAHVLGPAGVVGLAVRSTIDGSLQVVSCAHVLAPAHTMSPGGINVIESPPILDSGSTANRIGTLARFTGFEALNRIDAATCALDSGTQAEIGVVDSQFLTGVWQPSDSDGPLEGRPVWRLNRDRQRVDGRIQAVTSVDVQFEDTDAPVRFTSVVRYSAFHAPGDSGGAVIDSRTGKLIGIHFAGESVNRSYMCLAFRVFNALAITIDHP